MKREDGQLIQTAFNIALILGNQVVGVCDRHVTHMWHVCNTHVTVV